MLQYTGNARRELEIGRIRGRVTIFPSWVRRLKSVLSGHSIITIPITTMPVVVIIITIIITALALRH